tara:strand:+ start:233 stop:466 length:234 start_codon:yes stop_codon:yes gene_type:complete
MVEIIRTHAFVRWLNGLKDQRTVARILQRIDRLSLGNFGDAKSGSCHPALRRNEEATECRYCSRAGNGGKIVRLFDG